MENKRILVNDGAGFISTNLVNELRERILQWMPKVNIDHGLNRFIEWYRKHTLIMVIDKVIL